MKQIVKGVQTTRDILLTSYNTPSLIPETVRFSFNSSTNPGILHITSKYNIQEYSPAEIGSSFNIMVYNILESD